MIEPVDVNLALSRSNLVEEAPRNRVPTFWDELKRRLNIKLVIYVEQPGHKAETSTSLHVVGDDCSRWSAARPEPYEGDPL